MKVFTLLGIFAVLYIPNSQIPYESRKLSVRKNSESRKLSIRKNSESRKLSVRKTAKVANLASEKQRESQPQCQKKQRESQPHGDDSLNEEDKVIGWAYKTPKKIKNNQSAHPIIVYLSLRRSI